LGRDLKQGLVVSACGGQLHAAVSAWDGDGWNAGQAKRRGVAQQAAAGLAVVRTRSETRDRDGREHQEFVCGE
jgi:hypothetical protein